MALLALFVVLFLGIPQGVAETLPQSVVIIFDSGNAENSVGIVGQEILELGSLYEDFEVIGFQEKTLIVKERTSFDAIPWQEEGGVDSKLYSMARQLFVVKQMRAIYEAQLRYRQQLEETFAPDLKTLLDHGFLADGFESGTEKQGYKFSIAETGQTPRLALVPREPTFLAVAEPSDPNEDRFYFSVDYLGQVRFAASLMSLRSAPIWDYSDRSGGPRQRDIKVDS